jgi:hypothetical protein
MQIIRNVEQGSEEWLALRLGIPTCSDLSKIITSSGDISKQLNDYAYELASDMLIDQLEEGFKSEWMERGNRIEDEARKVYEQHTFSEVTEVSFIRNNDFGYSPDGLIGEDGLIEIKCPKKATHMKYLTDKKLPSKYKAQCQGGLLASNRRWCDFISYNPNFREPYSIFIIRVFREEKFIDNLKVALDKVIEKREYYLNKL